MGQESLFNVLKAYSVHDKGVGYCQGSPGLLLMQVRWGEGPRRWSARAGSLFMVILLLEGRGGGGGGGGASGSGIARVAPSLLQVIGGRGQRDEVLRVIDAGGRGRESRVLHDKIVL